MQQLLVEELIYYKVLPYNIYDANGGVILKAGEVLTPGKLLQLKYVEAIFRSAQDTEPEKSQMPAAIPDNELAKTILEAERAIQEQIRDFGYTEEEESYTGKNYAEEKLTTLISPGTDKSPNDEKISEKKSYYDDDEIIEEVFDLRNRAPAKTISSIDNVNIANYRGPVNRYSKISPETQIRIKTVFIKATNAFKANDSTEALKMYLDIKNKLKLELTKLVSEVDVYSQLLFLGEYNNCHALNTATLASALAIKMGMKDTEISEVVLAALLHDIGKTKLKMHYGDKKNSLLVKEHTIAGYKVVKETFGLSNKIATAILEHHENNDGSGYPNGISGKQISQHAGIISLCSTFDNLIFNRTQYKIQNAREALKIMLNLGTHVFVPDLFYSFIHMYGYNDIIPLEDMGI